MPSLQENSMQKKTACDTIGNPLELRNRSETFNISKTKIIFLEGNSRLIFA